MGHPPTLFTFIGNQRTIPQVMRLCSICAILLAACGSTNRAPPLKSLKLTKVVFRQYYAGSPIFVLENLAGRDIVKLRSKAAKYNGDLKMYTRATRSNSLRAKPDSYS